MPTMITRNNRNIHRKRNRNKNENRDLGIAADVAIDIPNRPETGII